MCENCLDALARLSAELRAFVCSSDLQVVVKGHMTRTHMVVS